MKRIALVLAVALVALVAASVAGAGTLFGAATLNGDGSVTLVSNTGNTNPADDYSGIFWNVPAGTTFGSLTNLSTDFQVIAGDCGGGSPRFQVYLPNLNGNLFVYLGPTPNFTGCGTGWNSSGNLIGSTDLRFDTSQVGGTFYSTYAQALALVGSQTVGEVDLVVDGGWAVGGNNQTVVIKNTVVSPSLVGPPTSKDQCKNGGWKTLNNPTFKNQGDCIQYVNTGK
jgi:hypothetical protein